MSAFQILILVALLGATAGLTTLLGTAHFARALPARVLARIEFCIAWIPAAWLVLFVAIVVRARISLGFWPHPPRRDPTDFFGLSTSPLEPSTLGLHAVVLWWLAPAVIFSCHVYGPVWAALRGRAAPGKRVFTSVYAVGMASCFCVWVFDPGQFVAWFVD